MSTESLHMIVANARYAFCRNTAIGKVNGHDDGRAFIRIV